MYLVDEQKEMAIARVQMGYVDPTHSLDVDNAMEMGGYATFDSESTYLIEVVAVDMGVYSEEATDDGADGVSKGPGKWDT